MTPSPTPSGPPSSRVWLIGCAGGIVLLIALLGIGGFMALRMSQGMIVQTVFAPAVGPLGSPRPARSPAPTVAPLYDPQADARQEITAALARAEVDGKLVMIDFGADWCPDCVVLSQLLDDGTVKPYLDEHYVVVRVDVGQWDRNLDISEAYGDPIKQGIPAVVVLRPGGDVVASTGGGELANARSASEDDILSLLEQWADL